MKINKKGLSLIEIIVSIALISTVTLFMYRLLADVTFQKNNEYFASLNQETKVEILEYLKGNYAHSYSIEDADCISKRCDLKDGSGSTLISMSLEKQDENYYFIIRDKSNNELKKWQMLQITDGDFTLKRVDGTYVFNLKLYTNNMDNNRDNNNTLDDISFTVEATDFINNKGSVDPSIKDEFVSIQCFQTGIRGGKLDYNPSSYDFLTRTSGNCEFNTANVYGTVSATADVYKLVHYPVKINVDEENSRIYVHFCRFGDKYYLFGLYGSKKGTYTSTDASYYSLNYNATYQPSACAGDNQQPCRTLYNTANSGLGLYSVEFITHYYNKKDRVGTPDFLKVDCSDFVTNGFKNGTTTYVYGEKLSYNSTTKKREVVKTCVNGECVTANGNSNL